MRDKKCTKDQNEGGSIAVVVGTFDKEGENSGDCKTENRLAEILWKEKDKKEPSHLQLKTGWVSKNLGAKNINKFDFNRGFCCHLSK